LCAVLSCCLVFFFFSSRRRHTRFDCDWGSDVCSSDLLGRVRKLVDFGAISLRSVDEYRDGGLHPGYAFPLFHGFLALISKLAGVDPDAVVLHAPTALLPLSFLVTYESGVALFRSRWAGLSTMLASFALLGLAPG